MARDLIAALDIGGTKIAGALVDGGVTTASRKWVWFPTSVRIWVKYQ